LLDGDHGCGKSLLALQIAASVSSGNPMPDGSPTIQGGVVIVSPHTDSNTTQLQTLIALGANLSRIEILSFIQEPDPEHPTPSHRPFSLPEDLTHLFAAIQRVDARLVIFDPFIHLLSYESRWTDQRLYHLLTDLNQFLIEHGVACLITRNCHAKGGHARPSMLERSDHFVAISVSLLLLAPDPMHPNHPLLSHAINRHGALAQTCSLQIQPLPDHPDLPHITFHGYHSLLARDFIENRLDVLHRRLLSQQLLGFITDATDPIHVSTLYALLPHCSAFQIQRSLSDLLRTEQIEVG
jgi:AAA domain